MSNLKKLSWLVFSCGSLMAFADAQAAEPGAYMGVQMGWGQVHNGGISESDAMAMMDDNIGVSDYVISSFKSDVTQNGVAGRIYAGWQFPSCWALELGWAKFTNLPVHATIVATQITPSGPIFSEITSGSIATDAFDLDIKGILPLPNHFSLYGKLGYAYLEAWSQETLLNVSSDTNATQNYSDTKHRYYPTFAVGAAYDLSQNFGVDLSYTRIQKTGGDTCIGSIDMIAFGAYLNFGYI